MKKSLLGLASGLLLATSCTVDGQGLFDTVFGLAEEAVCAQLTNGNPFGICSPILDNIDLQSGFLFVDDTE